MAQGNVFICYSRADMTPVDWHARLSLYLRGYKGHGLVPWSDKDMQPGTKWEPAIEKALDSARAAILLVGPGFLATDFVMRKEVPRLLAAASKSHLRLFPLIVRAVPYRESALAPYQAFNPVEKPLNALRSHQWEAVLSKLATAVYETTLESPAGTAEGDRGKGLLLAQVEKLLQVLAESEAQVMAQYRRRDDLVTALESRLKIRNTEEYEKFFFGIYPRMNQKEHFEFAQIRALTEGLHDANAKALAILDGYPQLVREIPQLAKLRQHLVFWLNKYERIFKFNGAMSVLYTGVEDGMPFPGGIEEVLRRKAEQWRKRERPKTRERRRTPRPRGRGEGSDRT